MKRKKIVIVGGGVEGWTVAALLGRQLPSTLVEVVVIEHPVPMLLAAESAGTSINNFHQLVGVSDKTLLSAANAVYRLGVCYHGWSLPSQQYVLSAGAYGDKLRGIDFHHLYVKSLQLGVKYSYDEYSINAVSAKLNRCARPVSNQQSIFSQLNCGFNVDVDCYTDILKENAIVAGVKSVVGVVSRVILDAETGNISAVHLDDEKIIEADFFIDCSGRQCALIDGGLAVPWVSGAECVFDRVAVGDCLSDSLGNPLAHLSMKKHGFLKQVELRNKSVFSFNFSSRYLTDEGVEQLLLEMGAGDINIQKNTCERKSRFWQKNCVAIGSAAAGHYDMYYSPLQVVRNSAVRLLDLLTGFDDFEAVSMEYNRLSVAEYEQIDALHQLHLFIARGQSIVLEEYFKSHALTKAELYNLTLFSLTGRVAEEGEDILTSSEWIAFYLGNNIIPKTYAHEVDSVENSILIEFIEKIKQALHQAAEKVPRHVDFISSALRG